MVRLIEYLSRPNNKNMSKIARDLDVTYNIVILHSRTLEKMGLLFTKRRGREIRPYLTERGKRIGEHLSQIKHELNHSLSLDRGGVTSHTSPL